MPKPNLTVVENVKYEGLPEQSFYKHVVTGESILIKRGIKGFFPQESLKFRDVDEMNEILEVTKAQAEAMYMGSMWGWTIPASNPEMYNEKGEFIRAKVDEL